MNQVILASQAILTQIFDAVKQLSEIEFTSRSKVLSGSSIGQHVRHTLEFFICLEQGLGVGVINYDKRSHDRLIETDLEVALAVIGRIHSFVGYQINDKSLILETNYDSGSKKIVYINTNYFRELTYNLEHAIHHMAIMKIGINEVAPLIQLPADFGVAASTVRYRERMSAEAE